MTNQTLRLRGALSITLLAVALAACGSSTPSAPTVTAVPVGVVTPAPASVPPAASPTASAAATPAASLATTGRIEVAEHGFALTLPDGWTRINLAEGDLDSMIEAAGELGPEIARQYTAQVQSLLAAGLAVFAFGPSPESGTNLTVLAVPGGLSLDLLDQINQAQLKNVAEGDIESERITLTAGDAIHYQYKLGTSGVTAGATLDQYFVPVGSKTLVVSATNATEADAAAIANSLEALD
jgi:hypothetical protein